MKQWANALATYDETAKANFKDVSILVNASLNEWERLTGRLLPGGASEAGGQEIAEQALYGLIMSGMSRADAQALLANEAFQNRVLAELRDISQVFSDDPGLVRETEQELAAAGVDVSPDALQLAPTEVVGKPGTYRPEQVILDRVSAVNAYIEDNPEKAEAVGFVMAAAQGPKGLIMWAAERALSETPFGEKVAQYQAYLQGVLGKAVAEGVEQRDNMDEQDGEDAYLIGGGSLIATLLVGAAGSKTVKVIKTKENTSPAKNRNPDSAQTDMEAGYPLPDRPVKMPYSVKSETGGTLIFHDNSGGHAVQKHVGKTDAQLLARLAAEPHIKASSTFNDLTVADKAVGEAFAKNRAGIDAWMSGGGNKYSFTQELSYEVGRVIPNGASMASPSSKVVVFLEKDPSMPKRVYYNYCISRE